MADLLLFFRGDWPLVKGASPNHWGGGGGGGVCRARNKDWVLVGHSVLAIGSNCTGMSVAVTELIDSVATDNGKAYCLTRKW